MGLMAPRIGRLYDRVGPRPLIIPGIFIVSTVLWAMTLLEPQTPPAYILAGHVVMSVGFALLFTPLFTTSMSSVPPQLYSHGSATLSSIQQVAGASGVALLIALMSTRAAKLAAEGVGPIDALNGGIRAAFFTAAVVSLVAIVCVFFVQRPRPASFAPPPG
jgi:MFS transporter, DHA2 family, lincomycin resistance protein